MDYEEPRSYTKGQIKKISAEGDSSEICNMLIGVTFNERDLDYAYNLTCEFVNNKDIDISGLAIICIAHLCRIHGTIPIDKTIKIFENLIIGIGSHNTEIMGRIGDAVGDFSIYCPQIYNHLINKFPKYFNRLGFDSDKFDSDNNENRA